MIYCTLLNPALDTVYSLDDFDAGSTYNNAETMFFPSGKGINVARVAKLLGEEVTVIGLMPEKDLARFSSYLEYIEIKSHFLKIPGDVRINTTILEKKNRSVTHINCTGQSVPLRFQEEFIRMVQPYFKPADLWCFSGSAPAGFDDTVFQKLIKIGNTAKVETFFDSKGTHLEQGIRAQPFVIKPNIVELEEYFKEQIKGVHHIALKGKRLIDMGVSYVFISLGADGMIAIHGNDCLLCQSPQVKAFDTVGCGDALMGGLLVGRQRNFSFSEMCRLAIGCGASKAMHAGPHTIARDEVWQLMEEVKITAV